jgi:hypothetical protein
MGERSMKACVEERLVVLHNAVRMHPACGFTLTDWYSDGAVLMHLVEGVPADERGEVHEAWGYIQGCADHCDVTPLEYIESFGLSLDDDGSDVGSATVVATPKKPRKKSRAK